MVSIWRAPAMHMGCLLLRQSYFTCQCLLHADTVPVSSPLAADGFDVVPDRMWPVIMLIFPVL